mgnify:FL=1
MVRTGNDIFFFTSLSGGSTFLRHFLSFHLRSSMVNANSIAYRKDVHVVAPLVVGLVMLVAFCVYGKYSVIISMYLSDDFARMERKR